MLNAIIETHAIKLIRGKPIAVPVPREGGAHDIYRCPKCQTAVWSDYGHKRNVRFVRVGSLDKPSALKPDVHIFTRYKVKWLELPKETPAFRNYYETKKLWPKESFARLKDALKGEGRERKKERRPSNAERRTPNSKGKTNRSNED